MYNICVYGKITIGPTAPDAKCMDPYFMLFNKFICELVLNSVLCKSMFSLLFHSLFTMQQYFTNFTLFGVFSSDVSRSSCTTSFTPWCAIFSQSYVFFQGCICPLLDVINVLHHWAPTSSFPRDHSENARLYLITVFVYACMSKEMLFNIAFIITTPLSDISLPFITTIIIFISAYIHYYFRV